MIRLVIAFVLIAGAGIAAAWLADHPGHLAFDWLGYRVETSASVTVVVLLLAAALIALTYRFWLWLRRGPKNYAAARRAARRQDGYRLLGEGFLALGAGDMVTAQKSARAAEKLLSDSEQGPALLLAAQAIELAGDQTGAEAAFNRLLTRKETAFAGLRGLLSQALRRGNQVAALDYARRAADIRPDQPWLLRERVALEAAAGDWPTANRILERAIRQNAFEPQEATRQKAHLALAAAESAAVRGDHIIARNHALQAAREAPDFAPAQVIAAGHLIKAGKRWRAVRLLRNAFKRAPHGDIARAYLALFPDEQPSAQQRIIKHLIGNQTDHPESLFLQAQAALAASDIPAARNFAQRLLAREGESARLCHLMTALERAEWHNSQAVEAWSAKVAGAIPDSVWTCQACGAHHDKWSHHCNQCQAFASLKWGPPRSITTPLQLGLFPALRSATEEQDPQKT